MEQEPGGFCGVQTIEYPMLMLMPAAALLSQDQREFAKLAESFKAQYNDGARVQWGGHILGPKSQHKHKKRERAIARELAQRAAV